MQIKIASYSALGTRTENEDTGACEQFGAGRMYAVVCDGLGSHGGGKAASQIAVANLQRMNFSSLPSAEQIYDWMERSNQEILLKRDGPRHMKTTAVALFIDGNQAVWAHIGDSRLYHYYNGRLEDATNDHSVCYLAVKMGDTTRRDIPTHPDKNKLLRALGEDKICPEVHDRVILAPGHHAFLLCSDGLWERLHEDEIMLDLHKSANPEEWLFNLRCRAQIRNSTNVDNNTAVAVFAYV